MERLVHGGDVGVAQAQPPSGRFAQKPPPVDHPSRVELLQARSELVGTDLLGGAGVGELDAQLVPPGLGAAFERCEPGGPVDDDSFVEVAGAHADIGGRGVQVCACEVG